MLLSDPAVSMKHSMSHTVWDIHLLMVHVHPCGLSTRPHTPQVAELSKPGQKVTAVCTAVRQAVLARMRRPAPAAAGDARAVVGADGVARALPTSAAAAAAAELLSVVVTSFVRSEPPQLGEALRAVRDAKERALVRAGALETACARGRWCLRVQPDTQRHIPHASGLTAWTGSEGKAGAWLRLVAGGVAARGHALLLCGAQCRAGRGRQLGRGPGRACAAGHAAARGR